MEHRAQDFGLEDAVEVRAIAPELVDVLVRRTGSCGVLRGLVDVQHAAAQGDVVEGQPGFFGVEVSDDGDADAASGESLEGGQGAT